MNESSGVPPSIAVGPSRLLVVDDHVEVVAAIKDYFQALKYEVDTAYDGPTALEKAQQATYDVILLDIVMPQVDGLTVCHRLKTNPKTANTGIVVLTAVDKLDARLEALRNGADDYVSKPFSMKELELRVGLQARATSHRREIQRALRREQRKSENLEIVAEVARRLTVLADHDMEALCAQAAQSLVDHFGYELVAISLLDQNTREIVLYALAGSCTTRLKTGQRFSVNEQGIVGHVCRTGESYLCNDVTQDALWIANVADPEAWRQFQSELCVPLKAEGQVIGCINIETPRLQAFDVSDQQMLETLAGHLSIGLTNARLYREAVEQTTELAVHSEILGALNSSRDMQTLLKTISAQINRVIPHHGLALARYCEEHHIIRVLYADEPDDAIYPGAELPADKMPVSVEVCRKKTPICIQDVQTDPRMNPEFSAYLSRKGYRAALVAPVQFQETDTGVLILSNREAGVFSERDVKVVQELTRHLALAVVQAEEYEALERAYADLQKAQDARIQAEREKTMLDTALQTGLTLSHEINNPLTAIIGFAEMLGREHPDKSEYRIILEAAQRIADVVQRLRQLKNVRLKSYVSDIPTPMIDLGLPPDPHANDDG